MLDTGNSVIDRRYFIAAITVAMAMATAWPSRAQSPALKLSSGAAGGTFFERRRALVQQWADHCHLPAEPFVTPARTAQRPPRSHHMQAIAAIELKRVAGV